MTIRIVAHAESLSCHAEDLSFTLKKAEVRFTMGGWAKVDLNLQSISPRMAQRLLPKPKNYLPIYTSG